MIVEGLEHRDYLIGGTIVVLSGTLLVFGLTLTVLFVLVALVCGVTYVYLSDKLNRLVARTPPPLSPHGPRRRTASLGHGTSGSHNVTGTSVSAKQKWKVTIGNEHTPVSSRRVGSEIEEDLWRAGGEEERSESEGSLTLSSKMLNWTWSGSPSSGGSRRRSQPAMAAGGGGGRTSGGLPLPRVIRVHNTSFDQGKSLLFGGSPGSVNPQRRYPTHQPQYTGLNMRPIVHLRKTPRHVLNDRNSSMISSPVTVKVAPPDVLKPPTPRIVPVQPANPLESPSQVNPCDTQTVLSAIREKRKRTIREEEETILVLEKQEIKRRRHGTKSPEPHIDPTHSSNGEVTREPEMDISPGRASGLKRPAISQAREESICVMDNQLTKRSRSEGPTTRNKSMSHSGTRNPIDVSYSSSRGFIDTKSNRSMSESRLHATGTSKKRSVKPDDSDSKKISKREMESSDASSSDLSGPVPPARSSTPRRLISLLDQDVKMADDSKSAEETRPIASSSSTQNAGDGADTPDINSVGAKKTLFPLTRDSSSRRRHTPIRGDSNAEFNKVPTLRYSLTVEDYAQDRAAEMARVQQMLDEVDTDKGKPAVKSDSTLVRQGSDSSVPQQASASLTKTVPSTVNVATPALNFGKLPSTTAGAGAKSTTGIIPTMTAGKLSSTETLLPVTSQLSVATGGDSTQKGFQLGAGGAQLVPTLAKTSTVGAGLGVHPNQSATSTSITPATTSVNTLLFKHTPTPVTGLADNTRVSSAVSTQVAAPANPGLTSSVGSSVSSSQSGAMSPQYSFKPVFGVSPTGTNAQTNPPPSYSVGVPQSVTITSGTGVNSGFTLGQQSQQPASLNQQTAMTSASSAARSINFGSSPAPAVTTKAGTLPGFGVGSTSQTSVNNVIGSTSQNGAFLFSGNGSKPATTTNSGGATTNTTSIFSFGGAQPSTSTAPTPAFSFGAGAKPTFGPAASTAPVTSTPGLTGFGSSTSAFGSATSSTTATTGGFAFTAKPATSLGSTGVFGQQSGTTASMFGPSQKTITSTAPMFGQSAAAATTPCMFGQTNATTAPSGGVFGGTQSQPATQPTQQPSTTFQFGVATSNKPASNFQFGGTGSTTSQSTTFNFNATKPSASPAPSGTLQFGQSATNKQPSSTTNTFGTNTFGPKPSTAAPAFGGNNAFGASSSQSSMFGQSTPGPIQNTFGSSSGTTQNAFSSGSGTTQNAFGSGSSTTQNTFGSSSSTTQNTFGSSSGTTQNMFGSTGTVQNTFGAGATTGAFGTATATPSKGFDFSGAAGSNKPSISFGGGQQPAQPQPQSSTFSFGGNAPAQPASFAFGAGNTSFGTPQSGTGTPVFGTPASTPVRAPNPFGPATTPGGQGAFTVGSGNTQPRPRTMVRAARRRTTKR